MPAYFLPIGAVANAIKGLSWMAGGSTKSVFKVGLCWVCVVLLPFRGARGSVPGPKRRQRPVLDGGRLHKIGVQGGIRVMS